MKKTLSEIPECKVASAQRLKPYLMPSKTAMLLFDLLVHTTMLQHRTPQSCFLHGQKITQAA